VLTAKRSRPRSIARSSRCRRRCSPTPRAGAGKTGTAPCNTNPDRADTGGGILAPCAADIYWGDDAEASSSAAAWAGRPLLAAVAKGVAK